MQEPLGGGLILGDDTFRVTAAVYVNVLYGRNHVVDNLNRHA